MASGAKEPRTEVAANGMRLDGVDVAPGVLETIVTLAAQGVDGVACVDCSGLAGLMQKAGVSRPVEVVATEVGGFTAAVRLTVEYGRPLREVAAEVQSAVADALVSQTGRTTSNVDVWIDGITFPS